MLNQARPKTSSHPSVNKPNKTKNTSIHLIQLHINSITSILLYLLYLQIQTNKPHQPFIHPNLLLPNKFTYPCPPHIYLTTYTIYLREAGGEKLQSMYKVPKAFVTTSNSSDSKKSRDDRFVCTIPSISHPSISKHMDMTITITRIKNKSASLDTITLPTRKYELTKSKKKESNL